ncbi:MAG: hypothetical protein FWC57_06675, partial [Endomicrobia bacterium]|nr:hypothetical protein [Endomicrobiia bacterium]
MFCKKIAVSVFFLSLFSVFASAQTVSDETTFNGYYYGGGAGSISISTNIVFSPGTIGYSGSGLSLDVDLQGHTLSFSGGHTFGQNGAMFYLSAGGRMSFANGAFNISNSFADKGPYNSVTNSTPTADAGAIYIDGSTLEFTNSIVHFTSNTATGNGGALANWFAGTFNAVNSTLFFTGNSAYHGGAIFADNGTYNFTGSTVTFDSNSCLWNGGAVYLVNYSGGANWSLLNFTDSSVTFSNNSSTGTYGTTGSYGVAGAAYVYGSSSMTFTNSYVNFTGNKTNSYGGAIDIEAG